MTETASPAGETTGAERPLFEARRLTAERAALYQRSADALAATIEEELGKWLSDITVQAGPIEESTLRAVASDELDVAVIEVREQLSSALMVTDRSLAAGLVTLLCGGMGSGEPEERALTRLDIGVVDILLAPLVDLFADTFRTGECVIVGHVSETFVLPDLPPEPAITIPMQITRQQLEGRILVAFSISQLQTFNETVDRRLAGQSSSARATRNQAAATAVLPVPVDIVVGFDNLRVPAGDLADLEVGDVLRLRQSVATELVARVGAERLFSVRPGQKGQRLVAEILSKHTGDERRREMRQR